MLREAIRPQHNNFTINIPNSLFGALKNSNINQNDYKDYLENK